MELTCVGKDGFRRVNNREAAALIFTFGKAAGTFLIDTIRMEYRPDLAEGSFRGYAPRWPNKHRIQMRSDYDPENLRWLGVFIHESTHIWQANTWHNIGVDVSGKQNYDYDQYQLRAIRLKLEPFASAVQDWFYVKYGAATCLIGKKNQVSLSWVRRRILEVYSHDPKTSPKYKLSWLLALVDRDYKALIKKIRDPDPPRGKPLIGPDADFTIPAPENSTEFRRVNNREAVALVYTFGGQVGGHLIRRIEIGQGDSDNVVDDQMYLPATHDPKSLKSLGDFIRKAARIWQQAIGLHTYDGGAENYSHTQLQSLDISSRQHSKAVQDWFYVSYGHDYCLLSTDSNLWPQAVRDSIIRATGFADESTHPDLTLFVKHHYAPLIEELRDPGLIPRT